MRAKVQEMQSILRLETDFHRGTTLDSPVIHSNLLTEANLESPDYHTIKFAIKDGWRLLGSPIHSNGYGRDSFVWFLEKTTNAS